MLRLAMPVLAEQVLGIMVWFSDRLLTGHYLGHSHIAAITVSAYVVWLMHGVFSILAVGATAMVARFVGAGQGDMARRVVHQAFFLGGLLAVVTTVAGVLWSDQLIAALNLSGDAAPFASKYLYLIVPVIPLIMIMAVGIACLRGAGDMVSGLVVMGIVNVVNVVVSWSLVLGFGPLPQLGWTGVAIGTASGFAVGGLLIAWLMLRGRSGLWIRWRGLRPDGDLIRRLLWIGLPGGADTLSIIGCQMWFLSVINQLGELATAAHGVAITIESLAFLPGVAFQMAAATLAGQYLGALDYHKASRSVLMALLVGGGLMLASAAIIYTQAYPLARILVKADNLDVARQAAPLLRIVSLGIPALALTMILSGALRGAGDTRWPLVFSLIGFLGVRIPWAYWLALESFEIPLIGVTVTGCGLGVAGAWYAMVADLCLRAVLIVYRFWHGGWQRIEV